MSLGMRSPALHLVPSLVGQRESGPGMAELGLHIRPQPFFWGWALGEEVGCLAVACFHRDPVYMAPPGAHSQLQV